MLKGCAQSEQGDSKQWEGTLFHGGGTLVGGGDEEDGQARTLIALTISALALARTSKPLALANLHAAQELLAAES